MDEWIASGILVVMLSLNKKWIKSIYYMIFLSSLFGHLGNLGFKGYSTYFFYIILISGRSPYISTLKPR